ncbi:MULTISPECIES: terminase small subunit [unclassified Pseudomonas]|uniref:terminase small subunit n=1 Tax=unclassified Pseudomonas TaxID=196821 RepID=UPI002449E94E|nr:MULTISPECIES: terminase small subunit [unclassified Pseudomonas]MDG9926127.1 terminase small subunit [Pseudomonas sp. GD04045]MDH0037471.1 terminase small subunit [Pseudomonas sp. GD04019]
MTLMAKAEYADRRGWSRAYVSKLVKQGRLVLTPEGKVDAEASDAQLAASADPSKAGVAERHHQDRVEKGVYAHIAPTAEPSPALAVPGPVGPAPDYQKARARREYALALLAEDEHRKSRGELVEQALVDSAAFTAARVLRDLMLGIPPKVAGELVTLTDPWEIERRLVQAIRRALEDADRQLQSAQGDTETN